MVQKYLFEYVVWLVLIKRRQPGLASFVWKGSFVIFFKLMSSSVVNIHLLIVSFNYMIELGDTWRKYIILKWSKEEDFKYNKVANISSGSSSSNGSRRTSIHPVPPWTYPIFLLFLYAVYWLSMENWGYAFLPLKKKKKILSIYIPYWSDGLA